MGSLHCSPADRQLVLEFLPRNRPIETQYFFQCQSYSEPPPYFFAPQSTFQLTGRCLQLKLE